MIVEAGHLLLLQIDVKKSGSGHFEILLSAYNALTMRYVKRCLIATIVALRKVLKVKHVCW